MLMGGSPNPFVVTLSSLEHDLALGALWDAGIPQIVLVAFNHDIVNPGIREAWWVLDSLGNSYIADGVGFTGFAAKPLFFTLSEANPPVSVLYDNAIGGGYNDLSQPLTTAGVLPVTIP